MEIIAELQLYVTDLASDKAVDLKDAVKPKRKGLVPSERQRSNRSEAERPAAYGCGQSNMLLPKFEPGGLSPAYLERPPLLQITVVTQICHLNPASFAYYTPPAS